MNSKYMTIKEFLRLYNRSIKLIEILNDADPSSLLYDKCTIELDNINEKLNKMEVLPNYITSVINGRKSVM